MAVYEILCTKTGGRYIGSSTRVEQRLIGHFKKLNGGVHTNKKMQKAWNTYGELAFSSRIIESFSDIILLRRSELFYIKYYDSVNDGYNNSSNNVSTPSDYQKLGISKREYLECIYCENYVPRAEMRKSKQDRVPSSVYEYLGIKVKEL